MPQKLFKILGSLTSWDLHSKFEHRMGRSRRNDRNDRRKEEGGKENNKSGQKDHIAVLKIIKIG